MGAVAAVDDTQGAEINVEAEIRRSGKWMSVSVVYD